MHRQSSNGPCALASCDGLADGWARRLANHQPVHASGVTRDDGPFYCAACHAEVTLHSGAERAAHFSHQASGSAPTGGDEGALHRLCKQEMLAALAAENSQGRWEVERTLAARPERELAEIRPDISGRVRGLPLAIEIQASVIAVAEIVRRTQAYAKRRIPVLWVVPVGEQLAADGIRPRLHERFFHGMYLGRTYYWWPGLAASVLPVHYGSMTRWIPESEWYRPGARRVQVRGYEAAYRTLKMPLCGPRLRISEDFAPRRRGAFVPANQAKAVPACDLWLDRLAPWW